ncbi:MAG: hypothetical protein J5I93_06825 [Pirellulaceae bacterium]|nr:hypothetical protein [Pirellulaceae bacterium]
MAPVLALAQESPPASPAPPASSNPGGGLLDDLSKDLLEGLDKPAAPKSTLPGQPQPGQPPPASKPPTGGDLPGEPGDVPPEPGTEGPAEDHPLLQIGSRMRGVERRIAGYDTSVETQTLQQEIVADLESLIAQLQKQCNSASQNSSSSSQQAGSQTGGQGTQAAEQASTQPVRDSTDRLGKTNPDQLEGEQVRDLVKQVWGHLPARVRELMRTAAVEEFLPKYERQIEAYYRRLAEEDR